MLEFTKNDNNGMECGENLKDRENPRNLANRRNRRILPFFLSLLIVTIMGGVNVSCGGTEAEDSWDSENSEGDYGSETNFHVVHKNMIFTAEGGSDETTVKCSGSWTASSNQSWCSVSPEEWDGNGDAIISITK